MANKKSKPVIPEPSLRFLAWSLAIGLLLLAGVLGYSLATGYAGYRATSASQDSSSKIQHQTGFTDAAQLSVG
jgi:hypothetical protein